MCQSAYRIDTGEDIDCMGDIRRLVGAAHIMWNEGFLSKEDRAGAESLPDSNCLCWVNLPSTLVHAGFKVWANPDMLPEYYFEAGPARPNTQTEQERP